MFSVVLYLYQGQGKQTENKKKRGKEKMKKETIIFTLVNTTTNTSQYFDNREDAKKAHKELKEKNCSAILCKTITTIETLTLNDNVGLWL